MVSDAAPVDSSHCTREGISSVLIVHLIGLAVQSDLVCVLINFSYIGRSIVFPLQCNGQLRRRTASVCRQCAEGTCHLQQHTKAQQTGKEFSGPSFHKMSASSLSLSVSYHACPSPGRSPARIDRKMRRIDRCTILENSAPYFVKLFHFENESDCLTLPANHAKLSPL